VRGGREQGRQLSDVIEGVEAEDGFFRWRPAGRRRWCGGSAWRLVAQDGAEKEALTGDAAHAWGGGEHRRQDQRVAVQRGQRVVVIQLEPLDEAGVHHGRRCGAGRPAAPADQYGIPGVIERSHAVDASAGPGQLRADQGAGDAVKDQVLGPVADGGAINLVRPSLADA
jgi:hypothetical protein